jgi:hypothetical protein
MYASSPCGYALITAAVMGTEFIMLYNSYAPSLVAVVGDLRNRGYFSVVTSDISNPQVRGSPGELQMVRLASDAKNQSFDLVTWA